MCFLGECGLFDPAGGSLRFFPEQQFPFVVHILSKTPRVCSPDCGMLAISVLTSDEFAKSLLFRKPGWRLFPALYTMTGGPDGSLLHMRIVGVGDEIVKKPRRARPTRPTLIMPDILEQDPAAFGVASASSALSKPSSATDELAGAAGPMDASVDPEADGEFLDGVPAEFVEDVAVDVLERIEPGEASVTDGHALERREIESETERCRDAGKQRDN